MFLSIITNYVTEVVKGYRSIIIKKTGSFRQDGLIRNILFKEWPFITNLIYILKENNIYHLFHLVYFWKGHIITHEKTGYTWTERTKYVRRRQDSGLKRYQVCNEKEGYRKTDKKMSRKNKKRSKKDEESGWRWGGRVSYEANREDFSYRWSINFIIYWMLLIRLPLLLRGTILLQSGTYVHNHMLTLS
jgi:hypothetical protein